jgi:hypothetical protein
MILKKNGKNCLNCGLLSALQPFNLCHRSAHTINYFNENTIYCTDISELSANPGAKISYKVSV